MACRVPAGRPWRVRLYCTLVSATGSALLSCCAQQGWAPVVTSVRVSKAELPSAESSCGGRGSQGDGV